MSRPHQIPARTPRSVAVAFLILFFILAPVGMSARAGDDQWLAEFGPQGVDGEVHALASYDGALIVGGDFTWAGQNPFSNLAGWNGETWFDIGGGIGSGGGAKVYALAVYNGDLIAAGWFSEAGGVPAGNIARWDGSAWSPLGAGTDSWISAMTVHEGKLWVGGQFATAGGLPAERLAAWDGAAWHPVAEGPDDEIAALVSSPLGLIAGGRFTQAGGVAAQHVARHDGVQWHPLGEGFNADVHALAIDQEGLVAAGRFWLSGETLVNKISRWTGDEWIPFPSHHIFEEPLDRIQALAVLGDDLIVGGFFWVSGQLQPRGDWEPAMVLRWTGSGWLEMNVGFDYQVNALGLHDGDLWAGGAFSRIGHNRIASRVARWDDEAELWLHPGRGTELGGVINTLCRYQGRLIAGGGFQQAGAVTTGRVAGWDGYEWGALGEGPDEQVWSSAIYGDDLIVGGQFDHAGGREAKGIAGWNGEDWSALGGGLDHGGYAPMIFALQEWAGDLIAAGRISHAEGIPVGNIARWDGEEWHAIGEGFPFRILALAEYGGDLIAAKGREGGEVFRWTGAQWSRMGGIFDGYTEYPDTYLQGVHALAVYGGELVAGGMFLQVGGIAAAGIARWDGAQWQPFPSSPGSGVRDLLAVDETLVAVGSFPGGIALWDGVVWSECGSGLPEGALVNTAGRDLHGQGLYVGGDFAWSGDKAARFAAHWSGAPSGLDGEGSTAPSIAARAFPNPSRSAVTVDLQLPRPARVRLTIHDVAGRSVRSCACGVLSAGRHSYLWDGCDSEGLPAPPGLYLVRLRADRLSAGLKLLRLP
ncbi:MAG: hypothetical protein GF355_05885 [Candidatus Eisenbacteria bacterium]|nr:hypothetical protein [Candidatus Eisenbacteria bacterium]